MQITMIPTRTYTHTYTNTLIDIHTHTHPHLRFYIYVCMRPPVGERTHSTHDRMHNRSDPISIQLIVIVIDAISLSRSLYLFLAIPFSRLLSYCCIFTSFWSILLQFYHSQLLLCLSLSLPRALYVYRDIVPCHKS